MAAQQFMDQPITIISTQLFVLLSSRTFLRERIKKEIVYNNFYGLEQDGDFIKVKIPCNIGFRFTNKDCIALQDRLNKYFEDNTVLFSYDGRNTVVEAYIKDVSPIAIFALEVHRKSPIALEACQS